MSSQGARSAIARLYKRPVALAEGPMFGRRGRVPLCGIDARSPRHAGAPNSAGERMTRSRIAALTSLYLLVVCAVGMLHPVRNALVLGALGGQGFYKVYLASALVAVAVALFGRLAGQVPQERLTPAVAVVFAVTLVVFRGLFPG